MPDTRVPQGSETDPADERLESGPNLSVPHPRLARATTNKRVRVAVAKRAQSMRARGLDDRWGTLARPTNGALMSVPFS
jgi:hypothetical protein